MHFSFFQPLNIVLTPSPGCLWLRGEFPEECPQYPHSLHALHVHFCRHCCAALQRQILLLHRWVKGAGEGLQVWPGAGAVGGEPNFPLAAAAPLTVPELHQSGICWAWWVSSKEEQCFSTFTLEMNFPFYCFKSCIILGSDLANAYPNA